MLLAEYDEVKQMELFKEEVREEGIEEGKLLILLSFIDDGTISKEEAATHIGLSLEDFQKATEKLKKKKK